MFCIINFLPNSKTAAETSEGNPGRDIVHRVEYRRRKRYSV